jgi:formylglycine-generating enzyme required for sulfatase activity
MRLTVTTVTTLTTFVPGFIIGLAGCGETRPTPTDSSAGLEVAIAPLDLPGISEACYVLKVTNQAGGAGDIVWQEDTICTSSYGDSKGSITYIGSCDASPDGRINSVTLELEDLFDDTKEQLSSPGDFINPCPVGEDRCILEAACAENADTRVNFDLTVLRNARQGFFDVAVNFEDIFCSSKIDCTYDAAGQQPIELLFDKTGTRSQTAVVALACTGGPGEGVGTILHTNGPRVICGDSGLEQPIQKDVTFASTCVATGGAAIEVLGIGAALTLTPGSGDPSAITFYPVVSGPGGTTTNLPLSNGTLTGDGGVVLGRLDDTHVGGFVFVGEAWSETGGDGEAHLAIWTRAQNGSWSLTSTMPTGGTWDFGDVFAWVAEYRTLGFGLTVNGQWRYMIAGVSETFTLENSPWSPTPPSGTDRCNPRGASGDRFIFLCDDSQNTATGNRYQLKVYDLATRDDITPVALSDARVAEASILCGGRIVATILDEAPSEGETPAYRLYEWPIGGTAWVDLDTLVGNAISGPNTPVAQERSLVITQPDGKKSLWACESDSSSWTKAAQPETGHSYDLAWSHLPYGLDTGSYGASLLNIAAFSGIAQTANGKRPFLGSIDLDAATPQATWREELLPVPTVCAGATGYWIDGVATRFNRSTWLVGVCAFEDTNGNPIATHQVVWELGVDTANGVRFATATAWHFTEDVQTGDLAGVLTREGLDSGVSFAAEGAPNCPVLIGTLRTGDSDFAMATWDVSGASGTEVTPVALPPYDSGMVGASTSGGSGGFTLDITPTFRGNFYAAPRDDQPVFQVGVYRGQESLLCDGAPCNKAYWNVAVGFDPTEPNCWLYWEATAASSPGLVDGVTDPATVYPFLRGVVQLTSAPKDGEAVSLVCRQNPVNGGGGLVTEYTKPGISHAFCAASDGDAAWSIGGCTWATPVGGDGEAVSAPAGPVGVDVSGGTLTTGGTTPQDSVNVTITRDFWIGRFEVTRRDWKLLSGVDDPSGFKGADECPDDDCPVNMVSWWSALGYLNALSVAQGLEPCYLIGANATPQNPFVPAEGECTGNWQNGSLVCSGSPGINAETVYACEGYRLPTEGEWELAARAGTTTKTYGGDPSAPDIAGCVTLSGVGDFLAGTPLADLAWYSCNSGGTTHKVGLLAANARGLHDMLGNVWEWVHDRFGAYGGTNLTDPSGAASGDTRVKRGGGYSTLAENVSAPGRSNALPSQQSVTTGFRAARTIR